MKLDVSFFYRTYREKFFKPKNVCSVPCILAGIPSPPSYGSITQPTSLRTHTVLYSRGGKGRKKRGCERRVETEGRASTDFPPLVFPPFHRHSLIILLLSRECLTFSHLFLGRNSPRNSRKTRLMLKLDRENNWRKPRCKRAREFLSYEERTWFVPATKKKCDGSPQFAALCCTCRDNNLGGIELNIEGYLFSDVEDG